MIRWLVLAVWCSTTTVHADDGVTCKAEPATAQLTATFKPDTSLYDLVSWVVGFSCKNVVIAPDVARHATKITIVAPKKMTPRQALQLFVDAVESTGLVVVQKPATLVIKLGPNMPKNCPDLAQAPAPPPSPAVRPTLSERVTRALDTIHQVDANTYELTRAAARILLDDESSLRGARMVPAMKDGKRSGVKLYAIRPSSTFGRLGAQNGDTLISINGTAVQGGDTLASLVTKLRAALVDLKSPLAQVNVTIVRRGQTAKLVYKIR